MSATSTLSINTVPNPAARRVIESLFAKVAKVWRLVRSFMITPVPSVAASISERELQAMVSVRENVIRKTGETQESITRRELVSYVQQNLAAENLDPQKPAPDSVGVLSVVKTNRKEPVYSMNVVGNGYYIIENNQQNQIINQQCDALGYMCEYLHPISYGKPVSRKRIGGL